ncbi:TetR/AcrR family transcriptional regulator [Streptomyces kronopolitis]|uniref:TetR/AcrR family transcriptional regulator n=1 Tax=Streptomyces kronopolitis TaxID=1612435 RepID=UPI00368062FE
MGAVKSKRVPRAVREQQMLDAAVLTFARRGYRAASMDEIAELAGVSKPLVYLYLNSKDDLFSTVIRRESESLVAAVRAAVEPGESADRKLWNGLRGFFAYTAEHREGWAVLHQQARTHGEPFAREVAVVRGEIVAFVTELLGAAAKEAGCVGELADREVAGLAHALVGAAESLAEWVNCLSEDAASGEWAHPSAKDSAATMMNVVWAGLGRMMGGERWAPSGLAGHGSRSGVGG